VGQPKETKMYKFVLALATILVLSTAYLMFESSAQSIIPTSATQSLEPSQHSIAQCNDLTVAAHSTPSASDQPSNERIGATPPVALAIGATRVDYQQRFGKKK
jgi:hypothetical protein